MRAGRYAVMFEEVGRTEYTERLTFNQATAKAEELRSPYEADSSWHEDSEDKDTYWCGLDYVTIKIVWLGRVK